MSSLEGLLFQNHKSSLGGLLLFLDSLSNTHEILLHYAMVWQGVSTGKDLVLSLVGSV